MEPIIVFNNVSCPMILIEIIRELNLDYYAFFVLLCLKMHERNFWRGSYSLLVLCFKDLYPSSSHFF